MAKETVLNEDAEIYKKRKKQTEREKFSEMTKQQKWNYFKEYYFVKVLIGIALFAVIIFLADSIMKPKPKSIMDAAIINDTINSENEDLLLKEFGDYINLDSETQSMIFEDSYFLNADNIDVTTHSKIATYAMAGTLDIIIADEEMFDFYVGNGYFYDLTQILPSDTYSNLTQELYMGTEEEDSSPKAYGIRLDSSNIYTSLSDNYQGRNENGGKNMVIGILANTKNKGTAIELINFLFSK